jgi:hypothetical protein
MMKRTKTNTIRLCRIAALIAVIGFMTACDTGGGSSGGGGGSAYLGEEPVLSGQVYTMDAYIYTRFNETVPMSHNDVEGEGGITDGQLSYTLGTPDNMYMSQIEYIKYDLFYGYDDVSVDDPTVQYHVLSLEVPSYSYQNYSLVKELQSLKVTSSSYTYTWERVDYVYVDDDVTVSGQEKIDYPDYSDFEKYSAFSLELQRGWNAIYRNITDKATMTTGSTTIICAVKNPTALRWVLDC